MSSETTKTKEDECFHNASNKLMCFMNDGGAFIYNDQFYDVKFDLVSRKVFMSSIYLDT